MQRLEPWDAWQWARTGDVLAADADLELWLRDSLDADQTVARARRLGADVKQPCDDVPGVGRLAIFTDPLGCGVGILQPAR